MDGRRLILSLFTTQFPVAGRIMCCSLDEMASDGSLTVFLSEPEYWVALRANYE